MTWKGWAAAGLGVLLAGFLLGRGSVKPQPAEVKTVEVIKWKTVEKITAGPGSTTTLHPDGSTTISGPVTIGRESEGSSTKSVSSRVAPAPWHAIASLALVAPRPEWQGQLSIRVGDILTLPVGIVLVLGGRVDSYVPTRFGAGIAVSF